ncbi:MAG: alpha/beta hydrolase [Anaerolineales bacterium]|nr:alpha/beta hydrolase [Anaerolineales bacterium]
MFTVGKSSRLVQVSKRLLRYAVVAIVGIAVIFTLWLLAWDDGFSVANDRQIMPGVRLNVQTAATSRGLVEYDMYGTQGPVVLSIHGGFGDADQGRLFASWLQEDGFRILSPSRPGYLGTPLESGKTYDEQADLLAALLDHLEIDKVGLVSYSAGSPVAYTFAARYPDRVWGLVSIAGVSRYDARGSSGSAMQAAFMTVVGNRLVRLFADVAPRTFLEGTLDETSYFTAGRKEQRTAYIMDTPEKRAFFEALLNTTFPYNQRTEGNDNDTEQTPAAQSLAFEKIKTPTLIVHGTHDADVPFYHGVYAYEHIPDAQRYWMEQEDHLGFWLSPDAGKAQNIALDFLLRHAPR